MRKRTSAATNARNRSTKSGFIGQVAAQPPELLAESPDLKDAFGSGSLHPEFEVVSIGFGRGREPAHGDSRATGVG